ncbi:hypothetical protein [Spirosoma sp. KNUC1025]|uniref:hypothetical protein n=1 Tax=Spirosoma sp. KNUC1025 TaxID=2894082 RepID=UPI0038630ED0|nr:hypothetical protein LN737_02300 [Spirosoma sp. KNUC1025]
MMAAVFSAAIAKARTRKLILLTGSLLVLLIGIDAFWGSGLANNGYSNALEKVFILVITIYYLTQLFQDEDTVNLADQPMFWVSMGLLVYNLVGLFDVFSKPVLSYSQNLYLQFYMIWSGVAIFMYGCFAFAFWRSKRFLNL